MQHSVPLDRIPDGLTFPPDLADQLSYDAGRKRLSFRGFMRKAEYDRLTRLSRDLDYLEALQGLFAESTFEPPKKRRMRIPVSIFAAGGLLLLALAAWRLG